MKLNLTIDIHYCIFVSTMILSLRTNDQPALLCNYHMGGGSGSCVLLLISRLIFKLI